MARTTPREATVSTIWAKNSVRRNSRLTSGSLNANSAENVMSPSRMAARPTSWISIRAVHRARSR